MLRCCYFRSIIITFLNCQTLKGCWRLARSSYIEVNILKLEVTCKQPAPKPTNNLPTNSKLWTQNSKNDLINPNITFHIALNKYTTLINSFGLVRHMLWHCCWHRCKRPCHGWGSSYILWLVGVVNDRPHGKLCFTSFVVLSFLVLHQHMIACIHQHVGQSNHNEIHKIYLLLLKILYHNALNEKVFRHGLIWPHLQLGTCK